MVLELVEDGDQHILRGVLHGVDALRGKSLATNLREDTFQTTSRSSLGDDPLLQALREDALRCAVAMTAASCLLSGVMGRREGSSALSSSSSWIFGDPGSSDFFGGMLQRKDAGKAGRRGALDHRGRRRAVYCAIICTPCRRKHTVGGTGGRRAGRRRLLFLVARE